MKKAIFSLVTFICLVSTSFVTTSCKQEENKAPKYVFLFIGDGMGITQVVMTDYYLSFKQGKIGGEHLCFSSFPYSAICTTYSNDSGVTCSSAAGTAIATGHKTNNSCLGVDAEGNPLKSMAYDFKEMGYKVGIMTNVAVNHATPASFYANSRKRSDYYNITKQLPGSDFDFFAGSGFLKYYGKKKDQPGSDEVIKEGGYTLAWGQEEFDSLKTTTDRLVLCQAYNKGKEPANYDVTSIAPEGNMTLEEMFVDCMDFLGDEKPFFIMCEGGTIDWKCHGNAVMETVTTIIGMDDAIRHAYDFYLAHPDETLIVVTADHETGGLSLAVDDRYETIGWAALDSTWVANGYRLPEMEKAQRAANITWGTTGHTGAPVPVFAVGKGAEKFTGMMDNTQIKGKILGE